MQIESVSVFAVKGRHWPRFPLIFVEVHTDEGLTGVGEALPYRTSGVIESLEGLDDALRGMNPFQVERHWETLFRAGVALPAISAAETALWDIIGQALGTPIYNLLGGACRDRIRVYADGFFRAGEPTPEAYQTKAIEALAQGFTALKMDADDFLPGGRALNRSLSKAELQQIVQTVAAVRTAIGDDKDLGVDCHWAFDISAAIRLGRALDPYDLMWFEDPIPSGNVAALAKVTAEVETPICVGEVLTTRFAFRELLEKQAADIIMPDLAMSGGILEMKKIAAFADTYYVPVSPHNMVGPIATMASVHLSACVPNFQILEYQMGDVPWRDDLIDEPLALVDGHFQLPTRPGLGTKLNHREVAKYRVN